MHHSQHPFPRSVHNSRIERIWYDITEGFGGKWKDMFTDLEANYGLDVNCHGGQPLVSFPSVLAFNPNDHGSLFSMVPTGLKPSTGLLGLIGYLRVASWSMG